MSPTERILADAAERDWIDRAILRGAAFEEGEIKGRNEGLLSVARLMLQAGKPRPETIQFTQLSDSDLDNLQ